MPESFKTQSNVHERMQEFLKDSAEEAPQPVNRVLMESDTEVPAEEEVAQRSAEFESEAVEFPEPESMAPEEPDVEPVAADEPPEPVEEAVDEPQLPESVEVEEFTEPEVMELPETQDGPFSGLQFDGFESPDMQGDFVKQAAEFTADTIVQRDALMQLQFQEELNEALSMMDRRSAF